MRDEIDCTTTGVVPTTNVVKLFALTPSRGVVRCRRVAIHDRIDEIAKDLGAPGKPLSVAQLATLAGFKRQTLNQIVAKSKKGTESGYGVLRVCAEKWGCSFEWLTTGRGSKRAQARDPLEVALEHEKWDAAAVAAARALAESGRKMTADGWARFLRAVHETAVSTTDSGSQAEIARLGR